MEHKVSISEKGKGSKEIGGIGLYLIIQFVQKKKSQKQEPTLLGNRVTYTKLKTTKHRNPTSHKQHSMKIATRKHKKP